MCAWISFDWLKPYILGSWQMWCCSNSNPSDVALAPKVGIIFKWKQFSSRNNLHIEMIFKCKQFFNGNNFQVKTIFRWKQLSGGKFFRWKQFSVGNNFRVETIFRWKHFSGGNNFQLEIIFKWKQAQPLNPSKWSTLTHRLTCNLSSLMRNWIKFVWIMPNPTSFMSHNWKFKHSHKKNREIEK